MQTNNHQSISYQFILTVKNLKLFILTQTDLNEIISCLLERLWEDAIPSK